MISNVFQHLMEELKVAICYAQKPDIRDMLASLVRQLAPHALIGCFEEHEGVEKKDYNGVSITIASDRPYAFHAKAAGVPHVAVFAFRNRFGPEDHAHLQKLNITFLDRGSDAATSVQTTVRAWLVKALSAISKASHTE